MEILIGLVIIVVGIGLGKLVIKQAQSTFDHIEIMDMYITKGE